MVLSFKKGSLALAVINVFGFVIQTKLCAFGEKVDKERVRLLIVGLYRRRQSQGLQLL